MEDMTGRVDMIIDGGDCDFGLESTIVKLEDDGTMTLLRPGKITAEELSEIAEVRLADAVKDKLADGARVLSPGMKYKHYAPATPLALLDGNLEKIINYIEKTGQSNIALLCYDEETVEYSTRLAGVALYSLGSMARESDCAHRLFALLRDVDKLGHSVIYARLPGTEGISLAIYNRMIRAAAHTIIKL
jgi:L-threonylcarbamoyladenylate synthase